MVLTNGPVGYFGTPEYAASNGWKLCVFSDCNEWDYFEWIEADDGRRVTYNDLHDANVGLAFYSPSEGVAKERYGFPDRESALEG